MQFFFWKKVSFEHEKERFLYEVGRGIGESEQVEDETMLQESAEKLKEQADAADSEALRGDLQSELNPVSQESVAVQTESADKVPDYSEKPDFQEKAKEGEKDKSEDSEKDLDAKMKEVKEKLDSQVDSKFGKGMLDRAWEEIKGSADMVKAFMEDAWEAGKAMLSGIAEQVKNFIMHPIDTLKSAGASGWEAIKKATSGAYEAGAFVMGALLAVGGGIAALGKNLLKGGLKKGAKKAAKEGDSKLPGKAAERPGEAGFVGKVEKGGGQKKAPEASKEPSQTPEQLRDEMKNNDDLISNKQQELMDLLAANSDNISIKPDGTLDVMPWARGENPDLVNNVLKLDNELSDLGKKQRAASKEMGTDYKRDVHTEVATKLKTKPQNSPKKEASESSPKKATEEDLRMAEEMVRGLQSEIESAKLRGETPYDLEDQLRVAQREVDTLNVDVRGMERVASPVATTEVKKAKVERKPKELSETRKKLAEEATIDLRPQNYAHIKDPTERMQTILGDAETAMKQRDLPAEEVKHGLASLKKRLQMDLSPSDRKLLSKNERDKISQEDQDSYDEAMEQDRGGSFDEVNSEADRYVEARLRQKRIQTLLNSPMDGGVAHVEDYGKVQNIGVSPGTNIAGLGDQLPVGDVGKLDDISSVPPVV